jgi:hypothetical protein
MTLLKTLAQPEKGHRVQRPRGQREHDEQTVPVTGSARRQPAGPLAVAAERSPSGQGLEDHGGCTVDARVTGKYPAGPGLMSLSDTICIVLRLTFAKAGRWHVKVAATI